MPQLQSRPEGQRDHDLEWMSWQRDEITITDATTTTEISSRIGFLYRVSRAFCLRNFTLNSTQEAIKRTRNDVQDALERTWNVVVVAKTENLDDHALMRNAAQIASRKNFEILPNRPRESEGANGRATTLERIINYNPSLLSARDRRAAINNIRRGRLGRSA